MKLCGMPLHQEPNEIGIHTMLIYHAEHQLTVRGFLRLNLCFHGKIRLFLRKLLSHRRT